MAADQRLVSMGAMAIMIQKMTEIRSAAAPPPGGHYAQAVLHRDTLYVSGQLGVTGEMAGSAQPSVGEQVEFALRNIEAIIGVVGASLCDIVRCSIYVTDVAHWDDVNRAYAALFGAHRPARSIVPCGPLHFGALVEIEAVVAVSARADSNR